MSESDDGLSVAATRQNATGLVNAGWAGDASLAGRENPFGGTTAASVIVVFCVFSDTRLSHVCGAVAVRPGATRATRTMPNVTADFIGRPGGAIIARGGRNNAATFVLSGLAGGR